MRATGDPKPAKFGFNGYIGYQGNVTQAVQKRNYGDIAYDLSINKPNVAWVTARAWRIPEIFTGMAGVIAHLPEHVHAFRVVVEGEAVSNEIDNHIGVGCWIETTNGTWGVWEMERP